MVKIAIMGFILAVGFVGSWGQCGQILDDKVTADDEKVIVTTHNNLRDLLLKDKVPGQPRAGAFRKMRWDDVLAKEAQKIANLCEFKDVKIKDSRFSVGQNLALTSSPTNVKGADWKGVMQKWFNENKNFTFPWQSKGITRDYVQIVWGPTYAIGCGYTEYQKSQNAEFNKLYVCNYGPSGNIIGQGPYILPRSVI